MKTCFNKTIILSLIAILLLSLIFNIVFYIKVSKANSMQDNLLTYLKVTQKECISSSKSFDETSLCLQSLISQLKEKPIIIEMMFVNYYTSSQNKGVLIFKNIGKESFNASSFRLYLNNELQDSDGCEKSGTINPEQLCTLNFYKLCEPGDILHVYYNNKKLLAKAC